MGTARDFWGEARPLVEAGAALLGWGWRQTGRWRRSATTYGTARIGPTILDYPYLGVRIYRRPLIHAYNLFPLNRPRSVLIRLGYLAVRMELAGWGLERSPPPPRFTGITYLAVQRGGLRSEVMIYQ